MRRRVAVLMGGWSSEREVSLVSGEAVAGALRTLGHAVSEIDVQRDLRALFERLSPAPDAVFNALHGRFGEDGCIQGLLNLLAIPYTHSGLLASALAMDKPMAKQLFADAGIPVAEHRIADPEAAAAGRVMDPPYVIKPLNEGSSVGVRIVRGAEQQAALATADWPSAGPLMIERYIEGRELTVAVMGERPLAVTEITTGRGFYDYEAKYAEGGSTHVIPAEIDAKLADSTMRYALAAHRALGCRGISRADFRFDGENLFILEVNTQPGMTPTSLVPEQAAYVGIPFEELVSWMVENAACDS